MATVYLNPTALGSGDGSSPANAARFLNGTDTDIADEAYIAYDTINPLYLGCIANDYSLPCTVSMFLNVAPTPEAPITIYSCASDGTPYAPPAWTSDQPLWSSTGMARFSSTLTNAALFDAGTGMNYNGIKFSSGSQSSGVGLVSTPGNAYFNFCQFILSGSNTALIGLTGNSFQLANCAFQATGSYNKLLDIILTTNSLLNNIRIEGVSGGSGNRDGLVYSGSATGTSVFDRLCSVKNPGIGVKLTSSANSARVIFRNGVIANNGGDGVQTNFTPTLATFIHEFVRMMITGNGGYSINKLGASTIGFTLLGNRFRGGSGNFNGITPQCNLNSTTASGTDADEYVDASNGDFRIKSTYTLANRVGVSTQVGFNSGGSFGSF
jgi:hypothetical protein